MTPPKLSVNLMKTVLSKSESPGRDLEVQARLVWEVEGDSI